MLNRGLKCGLLVFASLTQLACSSTRAQAAQAQTDAITVNVTAQTEAGAPLPNVPLVVCVPGQPVFRMTNEAGQTGPIQFNTNPGDDEITVVLDTSRYFDLSYEQGALAYSRWKELRQTYHFDFPLSTKIQSGVDTYNITLVAHDAITVTGRITNQPYWAHDLLVVFVRGGAWASDYNPVEPFVIKGVRKGQPAELIFWFTGNAYHSIRLTAEQTQQDVDLGQITLPTITGDSAAQISVINHADLWGPGRLDELGDDVTLIKSDGSLILTYPIQPQDHVIVPKLESGEETDPPLVPGGTYYVCPGALIGRMQYQLLDAIRDGHAAVLDAHGVPKITAPGSMTLNATEARNQILDALEAIANPPPPPPPTP